MPSFAPENPKIKIVQPIVAKSNGNTELQALKEALEDALQSADPIAMINRNVSLEGKFLHVKSVRVDLSQFDRILVIGGGKASGKMAFQIETLLGDKITAGVVNVPAGAPRPPCRKVTLNPAGHPLPSRRGVSGVKKMLDIVGRPSRRDLVICLISGGGSSLLTLPAEGISLRDLRVTTRMLVRSGAEISEINTVRKHLSAVSGGRLAEKLFPASVISLIISDVVGDEIDVVASGPTAPDSTTLSDAKAILHKYSIWKSVPRPVRNRINDRMSGRAPETPKRGSKVFKNVHNLIVGSNHLSCVAAAEKLRHRGYSAIVLSTRVRGEAREIGRIFGGLAREIVEHHIPLAPPACIVAGGETTVTMAGSKPGGRNQEMVLAAAITLEHTSGCYVASIGSDGIDGSTQAAGAIATSSTAGAARALRLEPEAFLRRHDSNAFFGKVGGLLITGHTGTNVNDIMIAMAATRKRADETPL